ncbi:TPA: protein translocase subunit SecF [Candidatus Avigastranaerophilus faecigallinarum]|nr:protein translocase subunit SecF [Candidatus Avigastranaerophilus faecigallinarum]
MSYSVLNTKKIIDVIKYRWVWLVLSFVLLFPGIIAMLYSMKVYPTHTPLLVGIDFTGGTIIQYSVNESISTDKIGEIRTKLINGNIENPVIQVLKPVAGENDSSIKNILSIRTQFSDNGQNEAIDTVTSIVTADYPDAQIVQTSSVGPLLGKQLFVNSMIAVVLALLAIVIYLTLRFHFEFAIVAFFALFHDVIFVIGVFSILGLLYGVHIDSLFVTAILTVLGFSVHDTIVVFDRIRENLKFYSKKATYDEIVNASVNQTLARSINTSLTTLITLGALYFFGGVTTKDFVLVMILGIAIGTYSSIFFASTLIALWNDIEQAKKSKVGV